MNRFVMISACVVGAVVGAMGAAMTARAIPTTVSPSEGGISQNVSLGGHGFTPVKKPVVTLVPKPMQTARRKMGTKVLAFSGTQIDVQVINGLAGVYDVLITPKDRGVAKVTLPDTFTILLPAPASVEPATGPVNVPVAILGTRFGEFKGKVTIGGRAAKVTRWLADRIEVVVPKKLKAGPQPIVVTNRAGKSVAALTFDVTAPATGGGAGRLFKYDIGAFHFQTTTQEPNYFTSTFNVSQDFVGVGASGKPNGVPSMGVTINHPALATPMPYDVTTAPTATGTLTASHFRDGSTYLAFPGSNFKVTITAYAGGVIEGRFEGDLNKVAGPGPDTITVSGGQFKALVALVGQ